MKLLLVEDNPADARLILELLKDSPVDTIEVRRVRRLGEALGQLRRGGFDLVLLDLDLPDSQGMETLLRMQEAVGRLPIVVLTGLNDVTFAIGAVRAGAQDYLVKGKFDGFLLARTIRYAVERKRAEHALQAERQRLFDALETLTPMICLLRPDHRVVFANRTFRDRFGAINDRRCYECRFGRAAPCEFCESFTVLQTGRPHHWEINTPDNRVLEVHSFPFRDADHSRMVLQLDLDITERRTAEKERRKLLRRLADAQENERARIARELHDQLSQDLTALKLGLRLVKNQSRALPDVNESVSKLESLTGELMQTAHRLAWELHPAVLDDLGLEAALNRYACEWSEQHHVPVDFHCTGMTAGRLPMDVETTLYRVTQEALTNVLRHARAKHVSILLEARPALASLIIEDDGAGFDTTPASRHRGKLGLLGMQERVALSGGTFEIESSRGAGTTVFVRVPLETTMPADAS